MQSREWIVTSKFSVKSFVKEVKVERAMVYRCFTGAIARLQIISRIDRLTNGAVKVKDFYDNAIQNVVCGLPGPNWAGAHAGPQVHDDTPVGL